MNSNFKKIGIALIFGLILSLPVISYSAAQSQSSQWSPPEQLSSQDGLSSRGYMVSDRYGYVHTFWVETDLPIGRPEIFYSRFDGESWSAPNDIFVAPSTDAQIEFLSPFVDKAGTLHLLWAENSTGPLKYSSAPALDAISAKSWSKPLVIDASAYWAQLLVDSKGTFHIIYADFYGEQPGIYYIRSTNQGQTWSSPFRLDPGIPSHFAPALVQAGIDDQDGLHAVWYYLNTTIEGSPGDLISYSRSLDGGTTWSSPFILDQADEGPDELRLPYPMLTVNGSTLAVAWAGDARVHHEARISTDRGQTWSQPTIILGDLVGSALGGGLAADAAGRIHYLTQVRYPQGIYHVVWDHGSWSLPDLVYLIKRNSSDSLGSRIHAHNVRLAIRNGNQLVITFTPPPTDPSVILYSMHYDLSDIEPLALLPTPTATSEPVATQNSAPISNPGGPANGETANTSLQHLPRASSNFNPAKGVVWGLIPALILLVLIIFYHLFRRD